MINGSLWLFSIDETFGELFPDLDPIMSGWSSELNLQKKRRKLGFLFLISKCIGQEYICEK